MRLNAYISVKENLYIRYMIQNVLCTISSFFDILLKVFGVSLTDAITKQELEHHKQSCVPFCSLVKVLRAREDVRSPDNQSMNEQMRRKTSKRRMCSNSYLLKRNMISFSFIHFIPSAKGKQPCPVFSSILPLTSLISTFFCFTHIWTLKGESRSGLVIWFCW